MYSWCEKCGALTEHIRGHGLWLDGCHLSMGRAGPHCVPCCRKDIERVRTETNNQRKQEATDIAQGRLIVPEDVVMPYGKHKGRTLGDIADTDLLYLDWLAGTEIRSKKLQQAVLNICARRGHEIQSLIESKP